MNILVTGTSGGIGKAIAEKFLSCGHTVYGIDCLSTTIDNKAYTHYQTDIFDGNLPELPPIEILFNNAGVQNSGRDIDINLKGTIRITENMLFRRRLKAFYLSHRQVRHPGLNFRNMLPAKAVWYLI